MLGARKIITSGGDVFRDEYSLDFDGTNDYLDCGNTNDLGTGAFSFAFWIKVDQWTSNYILTKREDDNNRWYFISNGSDQILFGSDVGGASKMNAVCSTILTSYENQWVHLAFTSSRDGTNNWYVNGSYVNTDTDSNTEDWDNDGNLYINRLDTNYGSAGSSNRISEIVRYNVALSSSQVATIYNGREAYNHKEGVASANLKSWWRMGDGSQLNRDFLYIDNSASDEGSNSVILSSTFDSNVDGWANHGSGTVSYSTTIASHSGSGGVLKCVNDATNHWLGKTDNITSGMESDKVYVASAWIYIPSSWSGTDAIYVSPQSTFAENTGNFTNASVAIKDAWQYVYWTFMCKENSGTGALYARATGTSNLEDGDFVYLDDFKLQEINKESSGVMDNMAANDFIGDTP